MGVHGNLFMSSKLIRGASPKCGPALTWSLSDSSAATTHRQRSQNVRNQVECLRTKGRQRDGGVVSGGAVVQGGGDQDNGRNSNEENPEKHKGLFPAPYLTTTCDVTWQYYAPFLLQRNDYGALWRFVDNWDGREKSLVTCYRRRTMSYTTKCCTTITALRVAPATL